MNENNNTMEIIEESKEALVEAAEKEESSVAKVVIGVALVGVVVAGAGYGIYRFVKKRKSDKAADQVFEDETNSEDVDVESEE